MDDKENNFQDTEYAGPPKSHAFKSNVDVPGTQPTPENESDPSPVFTPPSKESNLLDLIAVSDNKPQEVKKKKKKVEISINFNEISTYRKKAREYIRSKESIFSKLNIFWMILKVLFYVVGIGFLALCLGLYLEFESIVGTYLKEHNLQDVSIEKIDYSLNGVNFINVRERNGLFKIERMKANFSLADLLDKKIQQVELNGLQIFPKTKQPIAKNFKSLTRVVRGLGLLDNRALFTVQSVRLENSSMEYNLNNENLLFTFSGIGSFSGKKQVTLPVSFESENLSFAANMQIDFNNSGATWTVDILSGNIKLPAMEKQSIKGQLVVKTAKDKVLSATFLGTLTKDGIDKIVDLKLNINQKDLYKLESQITIKDRSTIVAELTLYNIEFDKNLTSFSTDSPLFFKVSNLKGSDYQLEAGQLSSTGRLYCDLKGCTYNITKKSDLVFFTPTIVWQETNFSVAFPIRLSVQPTKEKTFSINDETLDFSFLAGKTDFEVRKTKTTRAADTTDTSVSIKDASIKASYNWENKVLRGDFLVNIESVNDNLFQLKQSKIESQFNDKKQSVVFSSDEMTFLQIPYFKIPFEVKASLNSDYYFTAEINAQDKWLSMMTYGYYYPYTGEVILSLHTKKPLVFTSQSPQPSQISSLVSSDIQNFTGKVDLKGEIHYSNARAISGPLKLLLDDVSFDMGNMHVEGLNSVLDLTHLVPLGTRGMQEIYAKSVKTSLPFEDVYAQVLFDASKKQFNLSSLSTNVAGYNLRADPMWYGYNAASYMFSLKGKSVPIQTIVDNINLNDFKLVGTGTFSASTQVKNSQFILRNLELSIPTEGVIQYTPEKYPNPYLENLKDLEFKRLNAYLTQQSQTFDFVFSADNKISKGKKKTSFRSTIKNSLDKYIKQSNDYTIPQSIVKAKKEF